MRSIQVVHSFDEPTLSSRRVVLVSDEASEILKGIRVGAIGILHPGAAHDAALAAVAQGHRVWHEFVPGELGLSTVETQILRLRFQGWTYEAIAETVHYCERQTRRITKALAKRLLAEPATVPLLSLVVTFGFTASPDVSLAPLEEPPSEGVAPTPGTRDQRPNVGSQAEPVG